MEASSTHRRYDVAVATDSHSKVGVTVALLPVGRNSVGAAGNDAEMVQVKACDVLKAPSDTVTVTL